MKTQKSAFLYILMYTTKIKLKILHNELLQYSIKHSHIIHWQLKNPTIQVHASIPPPQNS